MRKTSRNLNANINIQIKMKKFDRHDMRTRDISDIFHLYFLPFLVLCSDFSSFLLMFVSKSTRFIVSIAKVGSPHRFAHLGLRDLPPKIEVFRIFFLPFHSFCSKKKLFCQHLCHKITFLRRTSYFLRPPCSLPSRAVSAH